MKPILECKFMQIMRKQGQEPPKTLKEARKEFGCEGKIKSCNNCIMIRCRGFTK
jgi:hypothetical protein